MANPNELSNQLKSQSLGEVLPAAFKQVGESVFPDKPSMTDLMHFRNIVHSWAATHSPLNGSVVPSTGTVYSVTAASTDVAVDLVAAAAQEVIHINAISVVNAGGAPATVLIMLGEKTLLESIIANPAATTVPSNLNRALIVSKGQAINITVTSGTATDITAHASGVKSCL